MKQGKNFPALLIHKCILPPPSDGSEGTVPPTLLIHKCILPPPSGHSSQFLLVPGGLLMCWVAKKVVDGNLQER